MKKNNQNNENPPIFINLTYYPIFSLGPGTRVGIWFQGCSIRCEKCIAPYSWELKDEYKTSVKSIIRKILKFKKNGCDSMTISGGEPFDQPAALCKLVSSLKINGFNDILVYSGYRFDYLKSHHSEILKNIDVLIDGPFVYGMESSYNYKGSENQNIIFLNDDARIKEKYAGYCLDKKENRDLQVIGVDEKVYVIGIPRQSDTDIIKAGGIK